MSDDERYAKELVSAGHHIDWKTGTFTMSYWRPKNRILVMVIRRWEDVRILLDSYVIECHPCCKMPKDKEHHWLCKEKQ